jgi:hypothetical protein
VIMGLGMNVDGESMHNFLGGNAAARKSWNILPEIVASSGIHVNDDNKVDCGSVSSSSSSSDFGGVRGLFMADVMEPEIFVGAMDGCFDIAGMVYETVDLFFFCCTLGQEQTYFYRIASSK